MFLWSPSTYIFNVFFDHFTKLAGQGDADAQYNLGVMYGNGEGVEKDAKREAELYILSANQGHAKAQYNLGVKLDVVFDHGAGLLARLFHRE